jgi:general stress protein CsbA
MADLRSKNLIILKGLLFLLMMVLAAGAIFCFAPDWKTLVLLVVLIWASARFYYFLFYVLYAYVDPRYRYAGIIALLKSLAHKRKTGGR